MADYLVSARMKFTWASEQVEALKNEVIEYGERHPYEVLTESNADGSIYSFRLRVHEAMPGTRWSLRLADCLQNFRSSLDHAIFEVVAWHCHPDPMPESQQERLQFPITDTAEEFAKQRWRLGKLRDDESILAVIEGLQPYHRPSPPFVPISALLRDLNNRDKHRLVNIAWANRRKLDLPITVPERCRCRPVRLGVGALQDGAEIMALELDPPQPHMTVEPDVTLFPAFWHKVTLAGQAQNYYDPVSLDWLLENVQAEVRYCLEVMLDLCVRIAPHDSGPSAEMV